jgi:hypothetical protein
MSDLRTAATQALEALKLVTDLTNHDDEIYDAITALKAALAEEALQRFTDVNQEIEAALAEPVLQTCNCRWDGEVQVQQCTLHEAHVDAIHEWAERAKTAEKKLAALAEPVQEPVAWSHINGTSDTKWHPPQRKPLTREEAIALWADKSDGSSNGEIVSYCRAIERAHGIT